MSEMLRKCTPLNGSQITLSSGKTGLGVCCLDHKSKWFGNNSYLEARQKKKKSFWLGNLSPCTLGIERFQRVENT